MKERPFAFRILLLLVLVAVPFAGQAELIRLSDGREVTGKVLSRDDNMVSIEVSGSVIKIPASRIVAIESGSKASTGTNVTLSKGEMFFKAGDMRRAWEAFSAVSNDKLAADDTREKAVEGQRQALAMALAPTMKRIMPLIAKDKYEFALVEAKSRSTFNSPGSYDDAVAKYCLAETRLAAAKRMCDRNFPDMALRFIKPFEKDMVETKGFNAVMSSIFVRLNRDGEVLKYLKAAVKEEPKNHALRNRLFIYLSQANDNESITETWNSRPKDFSLKNFTLEGRMAASQGLRSHAIKLLENGSGAQAIPLYTQGAGIVPLRNSVFYGEAAQFYEGVGDFVKSEQMATLFAAALKQEQTFVAEQAQLALVREKMKEIEKEKLAKRREEAVKDQAKNLKNQRKEADQKFKEDVQKEKERDRRELDWARDAFRRRK